MSAPSTHPDALESTDGEGLPVGTQRALRTSDVISSGAQIGGQYRVLDRLGRGGMGDIFLAVDSVLDRNVAIKFLRPRETAMLETEERFRREARLLSRLNHPNVVVIHSFGHLDNDIKYIVMEYVDGKDLDDLLAERGQLEPDAFCHIMAQVFSAVAEAHRAGIVHRDLKPANVIIAQVGGDPLFVKVLDFGLAKVFEATGPLDSEDASQPFIDVSRAGVCVGTPIYMSPEQARGFDVDGRSDVYSLAVMACQLLTGRVPLERNTTRRQILAHLLDEPVLPGTLRPDMEISAEIDDVFARALAKEPEDRQQTVGELARELLGAVRRWGGLPDVGAGPGYQRFSSRPQRHAGSSDALPLDADADTNRDLAEQTLPDGAPPEFSDTFFPAYREARYVGDMVCLCVETFVDPAEDPDTQDEYLDCLAVVANRLQQCVTTYAGWALGALTDRPVILWGHDSGTEDAPHNTDYAERAMDAALAIRTSLNALRNDPSLTPEFQRSFRFRVALDAGQLAVAHFGALGPAVHGPAARRARQLTGEAAFGEVWFTARMQRRVRDLFECVAVGDDPEGDGALFEVRGKDKLAGYKQRDQLLGGHTELLGRDLEREELHSALVEIVAMHEPRIVLLAGRQGMGKNQLVAEFIRDVGDLPEEHVFHIGRCAQASEGSPFQPFIEAIRHHAHIRIDDPDPVARAKLLELVREQAAQDAFELTPQERTMRVLLEEFLGISETSPQALTSVQGDEARRSVLFDAVAQLYHRLAQRTPIIFIIKDFELANAATKALVGHVADRVGEAPLLLLLIEDLRPRQVVDTSYFRNPNPVVPLVLEPLDDGTLSTSINDALRDMPEVPTWLVHEIARVSAGRPWFIGECIRCLVDRGTIQIDFGDWVITDESEEAIRLPDTFEEMFADRLEHLPSGLRRALDVAAVAGRFWPRMMVELAGERVSDTAVFELQQRGFIEERGEYVVGGEHDYSIVRRSMRKALYRWLDPVRRERLHGEIGDWLDQHSANASMVHDARIGHHFRNAGRWFEALPFTLRAARMARRSYAVEFAIELMERCLELLRKCPDSDELPPDAKAEIALEVSHHLMPLLVQTHREEKAIAVAGSVLKNKRRAQDTTAAVRAAAVALWMGRALVELGHGERAESAFKAADALLPRSGRDAVKLRLELAIERAFTCGAQGDIEGAHALLRAAMPPATVSAAAGTEVVATAYVELANAEVHLGRHAAAMRHYDKALTLATEANAPAVMVDALTDKAGLHHLLGQGRRAGSSWKQALELADKWDLLRRKADILVAMGRADIARKDMKRAVKELRRARAIHRHLSSDDGLAETSRLVAEAELALGRTGKAEASAEQAIAAAKATGDPLLLGQAHRAMVQIGLHTARETAPNQTHRITTRRHYNAAMKAFEEAGADDEIEVLRALRR